MDRAADGRRLPITPSAAPARRRLPLTAEPRGIDRAVRPVYAVWELTLACDQACRHCGSRAGRARPDELSTAECLDLVRQLAELTVSEVVLIGGEAYLRDDWLEIVRALHDARIACSMTTGGRGLDHALAREAKAAGLGAVSVSVDGLEATHDHLRASKGSFRAALRALDAAREAGLRVHANTQINQKNLGELPSVYELLRDRGAKAWQVQLTAAMGRAADEPGLLLDPWQVLVVHPILAELADRGEAEGLRMWTGNNVGYFGPFEHKLRRYLPGQHMSPCGAGRSALGIEAHGDIKGCPSLPSEAYVGGNVRDARLVEIWERSRELRFTRDRTVEDLSGFCRTCYYAEDCLAGCNWTTHVAFGRPGDNPYCHHRASTLKAKGKRERIERRVEAPGAPFDHGLFEIVLEGWLDDPA